MISKRALWKSLVVVWVVATALFQSSSDVFAASSVTLGLDVDGRELSRRLLHARIEIPAQAGEFVLWYPKWIPGTHAPMGPVENIGGLTIETPDGARLDWRRDDEELNRIRCKVPDGAHSVVVHLDYICNQPSANSTGADTFGNALVGVINWNTCILYPEGIRSDEIAVRLRLRVPGKWRFASALDEEETKDGWVSFKETSLEDLIDSPLIAGEFMRTYELKAENFPPTFLHLVSEAPSAIELSDEVQKKYQRLIAEAGVLYGYAPFPEYHFLVVCSGEMPTLGLEHHASSLNGVEERALVEEDKLKDWAANLLPHEFSHAWCGKYRRPAGMATPDFHAPEHTELLWVYEGLTQYLGEVLTVRSGFLTTEEYHQRLASKVEWLMHQEGRQWRSLEDTAVANYILRGGSPNWGNLRRGQDYYHEGLLVWLEADAIIRDASDGRRSLDDFCKKFFGKNPAGSKVWTYNQDDVIATLNELAEYDWAQFFRERVESPQKALSLDFIGRCGYRLQYATKPSEYMKKRMEDRKYVAAASSLGLDVGEDGKVGSVVPGMVADKAGVAPGMQIEGVNGRKYSTQRMKDAIADSVTKRSIEFLIVEGDKFRTINLDYADGPKYLELERDESKKNILDDILKPVVTKDEEKKEPAEKK
ncbi:MAG: M61 family peptidase [bacterium]